MPANMSVARELASHCRWASSLDSLCDAIEEFWEYVDGDDDLELLLNDGHSLPTFGGEENCSDGVWSFDESRLLYGPNGCGYCSIVDRA